MRLKDMFRLKRASANDAPENVSGSEGENPARPNGIKDLAGDIMEGKKLISVVKDNIMLFILITIITITYVAVGYQCQQDVITIAKLEKDVDDARLRVLSSQSDLTRLSRQSSLIQRMWENGDTLLSKRDAPFIIKVEE